MEKLEIKNMKSEGGHYSKNDMAITNFILSVRKIVIKNEGIVKYEFHVYIDTEIYTVTVSTGKLKQKFLRDLPVYIEDEKLFYGNLYSSVLEKSFTEDEILYQTGKNGLQKVNGRWLFVCTNGYIDKDGFHTGTCSGIEGMYIPETAIANSKERRTAIGSLFQIYNQNHKVFYPLFLINIMAITNVYFREIREPNFMKLTIWIDGASGSGKTELARAAGTYVFNDNELNREIISVTGKRNYALKHLAQSSGSVYILDDVKSESVRERRNSVKNIVDDVLRSVFQGQMTDEVEKNSKRVSIDSCAVITGEYLDTIESQNARMLYMKVDGFLKKASNSKALYVLQQNPIWLTRLCVGYIMWLLKRIEEDSFRELLMHILYGLREEKYYTGISNAERLNENRRMMKMAARIVEMYFQGIGMSKEFVSCFARNGRISIKEVSDNTFCLLGGERMVVLKVIERIFGEAKIRKAYYEETFNRMWNLQFGNYKYKYIQEHFWINIKDDFVWIKDYKKSLEAREGCEDNQYDENPCLIVRKERFIELFKEAIEDLLQKEQISSLIADKVSANLLIILREMQIIYKQYRADSKWGRPAVNYPVYQIKNIYMEGDKSYQVSTAKALQFNTWHPCIKALKEEMYNREEEQEDIEIIGQVSVIEHDELYKIRKAFTNQKSLYRE